MKATHYWLLGLISIITFIIISNLTLAGNKHHHKKDYLFGKADTNQDKVISKSELSILTTDRFTEIDTNKDKVISPDEFMAHHLTMFNKADSNNNGEITRKEIKQLRKTYHSS